MEMISQRAPLVFRDDPQRAREQFIRILVAAHGEYAAEFHPLGLKNSALAGQMLLRI